VLCSLGRRCCVPGRICPRRGWRGSLEDFLRSLPLLLLSVQPKRRAGDTVISCYSTAIEIEAFVDRGPGTISVGVGVGVGVGLEEIKKSP
jgi:hypothetical protein